jgi:hypothetical protein
MAASILHHGCSTGGAYLGAAILAGVAWDAFPLKCGKNTGVLQSSLFAGGRGEKHTSGIGW